MFFLIDLINYVIYKLKQKNFSVGFFCENKNIYPYIESYLINKKKKILLISFEKLNFVNNKNIYLLIFKTKFFQELFFLTHKLSYLYSSTPDLDNSIFKKTKFSKCKYIYLQHAPVSLIMVYNDAAFKNFNAIQAVNKNQFFEIKAINKKFNINIRPLKMRYKFIHNSHIRNIEKKTDVLVAPSWNTDFYKLNLHLDLIELLQKHNLTFHFRPHYMSFKKKEISKKFFFDNKIEHNFDNNLNFLDYNNLITDWSGIFIEFAFFNKKKAYLINTSRKIRNKEYESYNLVPIEVSSRELLGKVFKTKEVDKLINELKNDSLTNSNSKEDINNFFLENFY